MRREGGGEGEGVYSLTVVLHVYGVCACPRLHLRNEPGESKKDRKDGRIGTATD